MNLRTLCLISLAVTNWSCGGASRIPSEDKSAADSAVSDGTSDADSLADEAEAVRDRHIVECRPELERSSLTLPAGAPLRRAVEWYIAVTCRTVIVSRSLLERTTTTQVSAIVSKDKADELFRSLLANYGLDAIVERDLVIVVDGSTDRVVFSPSQPPVQP